jgi:hypothetical protein|tara:strand:+ start:37 stop:246 length:210 start_codon:yes stop_codon:yes gene_type:complete
MATLNDMEITFLVTELGKPSLQFNTGWYEWLGSKGKTGSYNDRWASYFEGLGIQGSLNDKMREFFCESS